MSIKALIEPSLLIWARKTSGLSEVDAAKKIGIDPDTLKLWESGGEKPSIPQLRKASQVYKRHFSLFFLPKPPKDFEPLKDFRRFPDSQNATPSPNLLLEMRLAQERHKVFHDLMEELGEDKFSLPHAYTLRNDREEMGRSLRAWLGIVPQEQMQWKHSSDALNYWRTALERRDIAVLQTGTVGLDEMRGFSIGDDYFPVIVMNSKDSPNARLFTMMHELAHIALNQVGLCTPYLLPKDPEQDVSIEQFCNHVAGAILLPSNLLLGHEIVKSKAAQHPTWSDEELRVLGNAFRVSQEVVLRRLLILGRTTEIFYRKKREEFIKQYQEIMPSRPPIVSYQRRIVSGLGIPYISLVIRAHAQDVISSSEMSSYLGVKLNHIPKIEQEMTNRMVRFAGAR